MKSTFNYFICLFAILFGDSRSDTSTCRPNSGDTDGHNTWKSLLTNKHYSAQLAPTPEEPEPDPVYVAIQILDIDEVNEQQMYYQIQLFVISVWIDPRLEVDSLKPGSRILLPENAFQCFWSPSLIFDNNKDGRLFFLSVPNTLMAIYSNKTVLKASRFSVKVRCRFDLSRYPMDVQKCQFRMRLFDESSDLVELRWIKEGGPNFTWITPHNIRFNPNIKPTQFKFHVSEAWVLTKPWLNSNFTNIGVNITFTRLLTSSLLTIYIPSTLIVCLSWLSFWIDVNGIPGRISLGIMAILTVITQILDIRKNMPPVSYVTAIDIWLFVCLIAVFLSLVEYAFAYSHVRKKTEEQMRLLRDAAAAEDEIKSMTSMVNGVSRIAWTTTLSPKPTEQFANSTNTVPQLPSLTSSPSSTTNQNKMLKNILNALQLNRVDFSISHLDDHSKIVFPVLFVAFSCTYWLYYTFTHGDVDAVDVF